MKTLCACLTLISLVCLVSRVACAALIAGDVDKSGRVNAVDVQLVINGALELPVAQLTDVDFDLQTNVSDVQLVISAVLGIRIDDDSDGLCNGAEANLGTNPDVTDTDGDGLTDGEEALNGTDPLAPWWTTPQMVSVPAGSFEMGDPWSEGYSNELPVHTVTLSAYEIGKFEVTNSEYADILNWALVKGYLTTVSSSTASAYGQELLDVDSSYCQISWNGSQFVVDTRDGYSMEDHPAVEVSWYGAAVYCNWLSEANGLQPCYSTGTWTCDFSKNGYHLPTEAQWERAAAWDGWRHWRYGNLSDSIDCSNANYYNGSDYCNPLGLNGAPYSSPVGYYADSASPVGCYDMTGNTFEWCNDWYDSEYYSISPETDPEGPESSVRGTSRVMRGGWCHNFDFTRSSFRYMFPPGGSYIHTGFRVARNN